VQAIENNKDHAEQYGAKFVDSFETYHRSLLELRLLLSSNYASAAASLRKEQGDVAKGTLSLSADEQRLERMKFLAKGIGRLKEKIEAQRIEISRL